MSDYVSLLPLAEPLDAERIRLQALQACLDLHRVDWLRSYLALDGDRMVCWYRAPDAEAVRRVVRQQKSAPGAIVWPVAGGPRGPDRLDGARRRVIVEFHFTTPLASDAVDTLRGAAREALLVAGQGLADAFTARSGECLVLVLPGEDVTQVARCLSAAGIVPTAVWPCMEMDPRLPELFREGASGDAGVAASEASARATGFPPREMLDLAIVGAGLSGICALARFSAMGLRVRAFESGSEVGGVWHWNRYPGARVDSETYTYGLSGPDAIVDEWEWRELFAPQPEIQRYLRFVVDRLGLRRHLQLDTRVTRATFDENARAWLVETSRGERFAARYLLLAAGSLSTPQMPDYPGVGDFRGASHHTARWPEQGVGLAGRRVGVIGTGATGVQVIQTIAAEVAHLTVFQRTPTYCIPQRNRLLTDEDRRVIRRDWNAVLAACRGSYGGFVHTFEPRSGVSVSAAEREAKFEALWRTPGFAFWFGNYGDVMMNEEVNAHACEFIRGKIRARVHDPEVASRLVPEHPFGAKRVPLENGYYDVFNRANVRLVDLRETPIERVTPDGIRTIREEHPLDVIVYATGFDAGTGTLTRIDVRSAAGETLAEKWRSGPATYLGLLVSGFPNLFVVNGPHNAAALCNAGRCVEQNVDWIARCIGRMRSEGKTRIEASAAAEAEWTAHVYQMADATVLARMTDTWFLGANTPGKPRRAVIYAAGARTYRERCDAAADAGYPGVAII